MSRNAAQVLLAGASVADALAVAEHLERWGCEVQIVTTLEEAARVLRSGRCRLALSETRLADGSSYPLVALATGSPVTLFFFHPVRDGAWWLPAVRHGRYCWGAPALRPAEFIHELDRTLQEISQEATLPTPLVTTPAVPDSVFALSRQEISQTQPKKAPAARKKIGKLA